MPLDQQRLHQVVRETFGKLPHPDAPELTNAEYPVYERVAAMMRNPHQPTAADVKDAYHQLQAADLSPHEWEHAWTISRPIANRLLGQDPTLQELIRHRDAHPSEIYDYYWHHPSTSHPEIKAGVMAKYGHMAVDAASRHLERAPLLSEIAQFASAEHHPEHIDAYYQRLAQDRNRD
jgi:hypothetical protein